MNRRTFLAAFGALGFHRLTAHEPDEELEIRFWLSERASDYDGVSDRVFEYLEHALDLPFWTCDISFGGVLPVSSEHGGAVTTTGEWPREVGGGFLGTGDLDPVTGVNLLVTDGDMNTAPTGYGIPHIASVGGARHIATLLPIHEQPTFVPVRTPERVMQILIHEVGHALGLGHHHGIAFRSDDDIVASPMLSTYAWDSRYNRDHMHCGTTLSFSPETGRKLSYEFSSCARESLEAYSGGLLP